MAIKICKFMNVMTTDVIFGKIHLYHGVTLVKHSRGIRLSFRIAYTSKKIDLHACPSVKYTNSRLPQKNQKRTFLVLRSSLYKILFGFMEFRKEFICVQSLSFTVWCAFVCHLGLHIDHRLGRLLGAALSCQLTNVKRL